MSKQAISKDAMVRDALFKAVIWAATANWIREMALRHLRSAPLARRVPRLPLALADQACDDGWNPCTAGT